jgi:tripartite-type tricarboxylate transporter receptor subunit TctC
VKKYVAAVLMALTVPMFVNGAEAQDARSWPARPIHVIVPFPAGGQLDLVVRLVADKIGPELGQPIIVENKTGADGNIAAEFVAKSAADGYTWLATSVPFATQITLHSKTLRYHPLKDFVPVANLGTSSFVLVAANDVPVTTLKELVAYAKERPGKLSYGGTSAGSVTHLSAEMFKDAAGIDMVMIPYAGIPPAIADLLTGRIQFMSLGLIAAQPQIKGGKVRPLAVLDPERHPLLPDTPSIVEAGYPAVTVNTWFGVLMPAGTSQEIVTRVNAAMMKALASPDVLARYQGMGVNAVKAHAPQTFGEHLKREIARWADVVKKANIKVE